MAPSTCSTELDDDVEFNYAGSVGNAATVIASLHRGEKRLVFCDSRQLVEELGQALRARGVTTFLSHASLAADERSRAEQAFAEARDCVIVSTSTLELGIDVGDLDRVIQINAPGIVAAFLQRLGRTGRRPDATRNCLFLALSHDALLSAAGLLLLWGRGYVEPVTETREDAYPSVHPGGTVITRTGEDVRWWTWAGYRVNATLVATLSGLTDSKQRFDDDAIRLRADLTPSIWKAGTSDAAERLCLPEIDERALKGLKFSEALPERLAVATLAARLADLDTAAHVLTEPTRFVSSSA